jgi:hypothetical protein
LNRHQPAKPAQKQLTIADRKDLVREDRLEQVRVLERDVFQKDRGRVDAVVDAARDAVRPRRTEVAVRGAVRPETPFVSLTASGGQRESVLLFSE